MLPQWAPHPGMQHFGRHPNMHEPRAFHQQRQRRASFGGFAQRPKPDRQHFQTREVRPGDRHANIFDPSRHAQAGQQVFGGAHRAEQAQRQRGFFASLFGGRDRERAGTPRLTQPGRSRPDRDYQVVKRLKEGGMSDSIEVVRNLRNGGIYVKKVVFRSGHSQKRARAELATLKTVQGRAHLNQMFEHWPVGGNRHCFILEYCDLGSMEDNLADLRRARQPAGEMSLWNVLMGVGDALTFLHRGTDDAICHLDIKPQNIFLSSHGAQGALPRVVLADFGCSISQDDVDSGREDHRIQWCGTPHWYPPEGRPEGQRLLRGRRQTGYGTKTDIYMLGASIFVACRSIPVPPTDLHRIQYPCGQWYSHDLNLMVKEMVQTEYAKRPSAPTIVPMAVRALNTIL